MPENTPNIERKEKIELPPINPEDINTLLPRLKSNVDGNLDEASVLLNRSLDDQQVSRTHISQLQQQLAQAQSLASASSNQANEADRLRAELSEKSKQLEQETRQCEEYWKQEQSANMRLNAARARLTHHAKLSKMN